MSAKKAGTIVPAFKAGTGNRTRDLHTTNVTLYRLSHASIALQNLSISNARVIVS